MVEQSLIWRQWSLACNTPLWPILGLTNGWIGLNWLALSCPSTRLFSTECIIQSALVEQCPTLYLIRARRWGLRVNWVKRKGHFNSVRLSYKNKNLAEVRNLALNKSILVLYPRLSQGKWVSLLVHSLLKLDSVVGGGA